MNKLLLIILIGFVGCNAFDETKDGAGNTTSSPFGLSMAKLNGCEYVVYLKADAVAIVHAGNCHNPEHNSKSLDDIRPLLHNGTMPQ